jgi:hypothetical protein
MGFQIFMGADRTVT